MKQSILLLILLILPIKILCIQNDVSHVTTKKYYTLQNEVIHLLDGKKEAMDGAAIWDIERVRWYMRRMHVGKYDKKTKAHVGTFKLDGKNYSIKELANLEDSLRANGYNDKLNEIMDKAIVEFASFTVEFLDKTKDTKHLILKLMEESCQLRNRMDSAILTWTETNGDEEKVFRKVNKSLKDMDIFFEHLNDFLGDLVASCPKGYAQFKKLIEHKKANFNN